MSNEAPRTSLPEYMPQMAAEFVQHCKAKGINLDHLPRTLPLVDRVLGGARTELQQMMAGNAPQARDHFKKYAMWITAYLGEVIRRETGGSWYDFDDRPFLNVGDYAADPMTTVIALFESGTAQEGDVTIESTKAYCELICRMQRLWLDGTLIGTYETMTALRTSMTPDAKLAGWLVGQAQAAVKTAKMTWQESLDFSDDSLDAVERILSAIHKKGAAEPPSEDAVAEAGKMWGVYLGEVIRRFYGGQWSTSPDGDLQLVLSGWTAFPIVKVRKRIVEGTAENVRMYVAAIPKALQS